LWSVYHRTYDSVFCLIPAALLVDFAIRKRFVAFSRFWLSGLVLLIISIPGLLVDRLKFDPTNPTDNPFIFLGLHVERLLVFGMFWSLLYLILKADDVEGESDIEPRRDEERPVTSLTPAHESQRL
jgi:hypothetical protein